MIIKVLIFLIGKKNYEGLKLSGKEVVICPGCLKNKRGSARETAAHERERDCGTYKYICL